MGEDPLFTVAFLELDAESRAWLQSVRARHDPQAALIEAHFTLLFGLRELLPAVYLAHVASVAGQSSGIDFRCRRVCPKAYPGGFGVHLYLVPDQGRAAIVDLHDRLYQGPLAPYLRQDLPYLPHITLGKAPDEEQARAFCTGLNGGLRAIQGRIAALTVGALRANRFEPLASFELGD